MSVCKIASLIGKAARLPGCAVLRRFGRREDGAAAIEFAMVAAPFLAMIFAIMETALVFFAGQALETAAADSARLIMTGQAQTQGFSQAQFKSAVCGKVYAMFDCSGGLYVDVKSYTPTIGYVISGTLTLKDKLYMRPRQSTCVTRESVVTTCS